MKSSIRALAVILALCSVSIAQTGAAEPTADQLMKAATTRPWQGENYPALPSLPSYVRSNVFGELNRPEIRAAYLKLDARKSNVEWFEGIESLEKNKAVWALQSCLAHPSEDVQIHALRSLERLNDQTAVPFLLIYAEYMAEFEDGSENATIHGAIHIAIAKTLSALTRIKVEIKSQDPEGLKKGIRLWRKWLLDKEK